MDLKSFSNDFMYLLLRLREEDRDLSERAIEYFWTNMLLRKLSHREKFFDVFREFNLFDKSGLERAVLIEKALKEIISRYPGYGFIEYKGKYVWIFTEGPALLQKACALADEFIDGLSMPDIRDIGGSMYDAMFSISIDSGLVDTDAAVAMPVIEAMVKLLDMRPGMSIYDPSLDYGRAIYTIFKTEGFENAEFFGLETDPYRHRVAKTALVVLGANTAKLRQGDPLFRPESLSFLGSAMYDRVILEPPSQERIIHLGLKAGFFARGGLEVTKAPGSQWDYIAHGLESLKSSGKLVCLIDDYKVNGILESIVDDDRLEAVIEIPVSLVRSGRRSKSIIVINKNKSAARKGQVLLAVADRNEMQGWFGLACNTFWHDSVMELYSGWKNVPGKAGVVSTDSIIENGYNISPRCYAIVAADESMPAAEYAELLDAPMIRLGEVADLIEGVTSNEEYYVLESYRAPREGVIFVEGIDCETREVFERNGVNFLRESDIVFTMFGDLDDIAIVGEIPENYKVIPGSRLKVLRVKEGYDARKLFDILRSRMGRYAMRKAAHEAYMRGRQEPAICEIRIPDVVRKRDLAD
ncbi:MAG TPA: N-6 DNA methylase [Mesotoga infera]|nr:N-6 DNA methylase [Mesotoga infera]HRR44041.1 N-6 DNA methylase [Mesotoga sp.]HRV01743.1 N-6 DNA methylase [Mesotoga sp.]